jgi:hypothetical protein
VGSRNDRGHLLPASSTVGEAVDNGTGRMQLLYAFVGYGMDSRLSTVVDRDGGTKIEVDFPNLMWPEPVLRLRQDFSRTKSGIKTSQDRVDHY